MEKKFDVSFVLPMFNERDNIRDSIAQLRSCAGDIANDYEIVIVDDASTDDSADIVEEISKEDSQVKLFRLSKNSKFGGAFAKGFKKASKEIILYVDSDMPVGAEDIKTSFSLICEADVVTGYSNVKKGDTLLRKIISLSYNMLVKVLFGLKVRDINSGYKIVRKKVIDDLEFISRSPFIDVEIFLQAKKNNYRVKQFPMIFRTRMGGRSYIASLPIIFATFRDMFKVKINSCR